MHHTIRAPLHPPQPRNHLRLRRQARTHLRRRGRLLQVGRCRAEGRQELSAQKGARNNEFQNAFDARVDTGGEWVDVLDGGFDWCWGGKEGVQISVG